MHAFLVPCAWGVGRATGLCGGADVPQAGTALHCTALRWLRLRAAHWPGYALEMYGHRGASVS